MTISEMIKKLEKIKSTKGDMEVRHYEQKHYAFHRIKTICVVEKQPYGIIGDDSPVFVGIY